MNRTVHAPSPFPATGRSKHTTSPPPSRSVTRAVPTGSVSPYISVDMTGGGRSGPRSSCSPSSSPSPSDSPSPERAAPTPSQSTTPGAQGKVMRCSPWAWWQYKCPPDRGSTSSSESGILPPGAAGLPSWTDSTARRESWFGPLLRRARSHITCARASAPPPAAPSRASPGAQMQSTRESSQRGSRLPARSCTVTVPSEFAWDTTVHPGPGEPTARAHASDPPPCRSGTTARGPRRAGAASRRTKACASTSAAVPRATSGNTWESHRAARSRSSPSISAGRPSRSARTSARG